MPLQAKASKGKPAWALTAEEILSKEEQEEAALLDFADNLDFDSYVSHLDDVQLQEALQVSCCIPVAFNSAVLQASCMTCTRQAQLAAH